MWEIIHWVLGVLVLIIGGLLAIAWGTKPSHEDVRGMIQTAMEQVAKAAATAREQMEGHFREQIENQAKLFDEKLKRVEAGVAYSNRSLDMIIEHMGMMPIAKRERRGQ
jgi:hypothetical protein